MSRRIRFVRGRRGCRRTWRSAGRTRMIERREFFIAHNDDVRIGFLFRFAPRHGRGRRLDACPLWSCVQAAATPHNTNSETAARQFEFSWQAPSQTRRSVIGRSVNIREVNDDTSANAMIRPRPEERVLIGKRGKQSAVVRHEADEQQCHANKRGLATRDANQCAKCHTRRISCGKCRPARHKRPTGSPIAQPVCKGTSASHEPA